MTQKLNKVLILFPSNCFFSLLRRVMAVQVYFNGNNFGPDFILTEYLLYTSPQHSIINNPASLLKAPSPIRFYSELWYHHPHSAAIEYWSHNLWWLSSWEKRWKQPFKKNIFFALGSFIHDISLFVILMS